MNLAQVARILAGFTLFFSLIQGIPLLMAYYVDDPTQLTSGRSIDAKRGFVISIGAGILASVLFWAGGRGASAQFFRKEGLIVVGGAWLVSSLLGAIPFSASGAMPVVADAVFESVSGLTTTGASVLGGTDQFPIEELPQSLLFWRSLLQWMGGLGIILVFIVLLPAMGVTGKNLLSSEQVGVSSDTMRPRMQQQARSLFRLYLILTAAATVTYWGILTYQGGTPNEFFHALCHAFTTVATGGFSTQNSSVNSFANPPMEIAVIVFMFLGGCNFTLLISSVRTGVSSPLRIFKNPEFRVYFGLIVLLSVVMSFIVWTGNEEISYGYLESLRHATFCITSILTSTGYGTEDSTLWPHAAAALIIFCMLSGGCSGSTAGGFKIVRLLVVHKLAIYHLRHFIRPKSVEKIRVGHDVVSNAAVSAIVSTLILSFGIICLGTFVFSFDDRLPLFDAFSINVSMVSCTGPAPTSFPAGGSGINVGPCGSFGDLYSWQKLLMCFQMVLGRLELLVPLALITPGFWKR